MSGLGKKSAPLTARRRRLILAAFQADNTPRYAIDLVRETGVYRELLWSYLYALREGGLVERVPSPLRKGGWRWYATEAGLQVDSGDAVIEVAYLAGNAVPANGSSKRYQADALCAAYGMHLLRHQAVARLVSYK